MSIFEEDSRTDYERERDDRRERDDPCEHDVGDDPDPAEWRDSVCADCARRMGYAPKYKVAGVWTGHCDFCGNEKPLTSLIHDWERPSPRRRGKARTDNAH